MINSSGKIVILGILAVALASAAASWWFRYAATHRAAEFWGPQAARLIRDAPIVEMYQFTAPIDFPSQPHRVADLLPESESARVISSAPGLTHLRNALLEDRSYHWPAQPHQPDDRWQWVLVFRESRSGERLAVWFSPDWKQLTRPGDGRVLSAKPIADGLTEMFGEITAESPSAR